MSRYVDGQTRSILLHSEDNIETNQMKYKRLQSKHTKLIKRIKAIHHSQTHVLFCIIMVENKVSFLRYFFVMRHIDFY